MADAEVGSKHDRLAAAAAELADADADEQYEHVRHSNLFRRFLTWWMSWCIPGIGMFSEAYFVFAIGNLKPLFKKKYPDCFVQPPSPTANPNDVCSPKLANTLTYTQVSGIIFGQLVIGFFTDRIGRKWGSVMNAAIMLVFGTLMACSTGSGTNAIFTMFTIVQCFFGVGVGGEYPVASTSANERAENTKHLQQRRGETVVCVFSMQGWGNLANTIVILALLAMFGQYGPKYDNSDLNVVWRLSYGLGLIPIFFMLCWRVFKLKESKVWLRKRSSLKSLGENEGAGWHRTWLLIKHYWHRVGGAALSWFVWDFAFYGNKLFQSTFINVITGGHASLITTLEWTLLNSSVALVGYYFAAFTMDKLWMGRKRMQMMGFAWMGLLFIICAADYTHLTSGNTTALHWFQFLYFFSSFWGQFGPNATTWLIPAEVAPTEMRSQCHGFAAAVGKAGALVAGVVFGLVSNNVQFYISAACGFAGVVVTFVFIPELVGLDLKEGDKRWLAIVSGAEAEYCGEAINPKHLSFLEKLMGYGKLYSPKAADDLSGGDQQQGSESKEAFIAITSSTSATVGGGGSANGASGKASTL